MANDELQQKVVGWFQPHVRPSWDGRIVDPGTGEIVPDPKAVSMTKQNFKDECDINNIVRKFEATQNVDLLNLKKGYFADLPSGLDLQGAYAQIKQAEEAFMALPAAERAVYDNDPVRFAEAFTNPTAADQERWIKLGLATDTRSPKPDAPASPPEGGTGGGGKSS